MIRDKYVGFKVGDEEKEELEKRAKSKGLNVSEYLRALAFNQVSSLIEPDKPLCENPAKAESAEIESESLATLPSTMAVGSLQEIHAVHSAQMADIQVMLKKIMCQNSYIAEGIFKVFYYLTSFFQWFKYFCQHLKWQPPIDCHYPNKKDKDKFVQERFAELNSRLEEIR